MLQRLAPQQLHYQVWAAVVFPGVMDGADVGMVQGSGRTGLAQEALMGDMAGIGCRVYGRDRRGRATANSRDEIGVGNQLERDFTLQARIQGTIHLAHSARTDLLDQAVRTKLCSFCDRHRPWLTRQINAE